MELLRNLRSRMAALTTQPEIQPHDLLLHRAEGLQEVGQAMAIHGHVGQDTLVPMALSVRTGSAGDVSTSCNSRDPLEKSLAAVAELGLHREFVADHIAQRVADMRSHGVGLVELQ